MLDSSLTIETKHDKRVPLSLGMTSLQFAASILHRPPTVQAVPARRTPGPGGAIEPLAQPLAKQSATTDARADKKEKSAATLEDITAKTTTLATHRKEIQLAADQAWPWRSQNIESTRKAPPWTGH